MRGLMGTGDGHGFFMLISDFNTHLFSVMLFHY